MCAKLPARNFPPWLLGKSQVRLRLVKGFAPGTASLNSSQWQLRQVSTTPPTPGSAVSGPEYQAGWVGRSAHLHVCLPGNGYSRALYHKQEQRAPRQKQVGVHRGHIRCAVIRYKARETWSNCSCSQPARASKTAEPLWCEEPETVGHTPTVGLGHGSLKLKESRT